MANESKANDVFLIMSNGKIDQLYDYWIYGKDAVPKTSRWSIVKDVLGWVE